MTEKCAIDPGRECLGLAEAALLRKRIEDLEQWQKDSKKFHNDFYDSNGRYNSWNTSNSYGVRPAFTLPSDFRI